jgi:predicted dehydrogenase
MAIHTLDAARFMSGKVPLAVYCHQSNPINSWWAHGAVANAIFEMSDGVVFTYRGSWAAEGANTSWDSAWRIVGTKGTILWDGADRLEGNAVAGTEGFFRPLVPVEISVASPHETDGHASVIGAFLDALETGKTPETVGTDNFKSLSMVFAAIESSRHGRRVEITS